MMWFLPNAAWIEVVQLVLALVGVGVSFYRLWVAIENGLLITTTQSTDLRRVIAETQVVGELFRLFAQGCLTAIGIISVLLPPPGAVAVVAPDFEALQSTLVRMGLITLTAVMVTDSLVQEWRRRSFLLMVDIVAVPLPPLSPPPAPSTHVSGGLDGPVP